MLITKEGKERVDADFFCEFRGVLTKKIGQCGIIMFDVTYRLPTTSRTGIVIWRGFVRTSQSFFAGTRLMSRWVLQSGPWVGASEGRGLITDVTGLHCGFSFRSAKLRHPASPSTVKKNLQYFEIFRQVKLQL